MADWSLPTLSSSYSDLISGLTSRDSDIAKMFDGTGTNLPSGTIRWSSTNSKFEKYNGTTWSALTAKYLFDVDSVDGCNVDDSAAASTSVLWTSNKINTFAGDYYTKSQIDTLRSSYLLKNGENGTLTFGTNDNSAVNIETNNTTRFSIGGTGNATLNAPTSGVALTISGASGSNAIQADQPIQSTQLKSTIATGTSPIVVSSTTVVTNLNSDLLDGQDGTYYTNMGNASSGTLAVGRGGTGTTTSTGTGSVVLSNSPTFTGSPILPSTTTIGNVSSTELGYLDGVTSAIQTQIDSKASSSHSHTLSSITDFPSAVSSTELGYLDGASSNIQSQLNTITSNVSSKIGATNYASSDGTTGGTMKARFDGTTLYITTDGSNA